MVGPRPVLVVGAGPVGLTAAAFLAHSGTPVKIIDSNAGPTVLSKALVLWRRSVMTLDPLIPHEHWLTVGCTVKGAYFGDEGVAGGYNDLQNPSNTSEETYKRDGRAHMLPTGCLVTQEDVEATLVIVLQEKYGVTVQRNSTVTSFSVSEDGHFVTCNIQSTNPSTGQQQQEQLEVLHLIACDGARSTVRKQLGLNFTGCTLDQRWWLADVRYQVQDGLNPKQPRQEVERAPSSDSLFLCTSSVGVIGLLPLAGQEGIVRIVWNADSLGPSQATLEDFQQLLLDHTRMQIKLTEAVWINEYKINERQVERYVHAGGRVLLAGDAAHVHSPAGGQGMNTGIQDAANLAWKVALVVAGEAAAGQHLLETYQEERWPIGAAVIRRTGVMLRSNTVRNYFVRMLRWLGLKLLSSLPAVRQKMVTNLAGDDIAYPSSSLAAAETRASNSSSSMVTSSGPSNAVSPTAKAVWGSCRPGFGFPDVSVMVKGEARPATDLLRCEAGCFGTLVVLTAAALAPAGNGDCDATQQSWPAKWGHWLLHVVRVCKGQADKDTSSTADVVDQWGLLEAVVGVGPQVVELGVLVRPDGVVAAVGGPQVIKQWLDKHVTAQH